MLLAKSVSRAATHVFRQDGLPDAHEFLDVLGNARLQLDTQNGKREAKGVSRGRRERLLGAWV